MQDVEEGSGSQFRMARWAQGMVGVDISSRKIVMRSLFLIHLASANSCLSECKGIGSRVTRWGLFLTRGFPLYFLGPSGCYGLHRSWHANALSPETGSVKRRSNDEIHE